ncbi:hypothetical protein [Streptomyces sp. NPDC026589]
MTACVQVSTTTVDGRPVTASARAIVEDLRQRPALIRENHPVMTSTKLA